MKILPFTNWTVLGKTNNIALASSIIFPILDFLLIFANSDNFPIAIPIWYSRLWGEQQLAAPVFLWLIPLVSFFVALLNLSVSFYFYERSPIVSKIIIWSAPLINLVLFISLLEIVRVGR